MQTYGERVLGEKGGAFQENFVVTPYSQEMSTAFGLNEGQYSRMVEMSDFLVLNSTQCRAILVVKLTGTK